MFATNEIFVGPVLFFSGYLSRALSFAFGEISNVCLKVICECYLDLHLSSDVRAHAHKPPNNDIKRSKRS